MSAPEPTPGERTRLSRWRRTFGLVFVFSTVIFLLLSTILFALGAAPGLFRAIPSGTPTLAPTVTLPPQTGTALPTPVPTQPPTTEPPSAVGGSAPGGSLALLTSILGIVASCLTSVTTFVGFVVTTVMTISKGRRDARDAELDRKMRELELEKRKFELEELKRQNKPPDEGHPAGS